MGNKKAKIYTYYRTLAWIDNDKSYSMIAEFYTLGMYAVINNSRMGFEHKKFIKFQTELIKKLESEKITVTKGQLMKITDRTGDWQIVNDKQEVLKQC